MKTHPKQLLAAGLLAAFGLSAFAQTPAPAPAVRGGPEAHQAQRGQHMDPAKRQELRKIRMERRLAAIKLKLQIGAAQEAAWNAWTAAIKPAGTPRPRIDRAEFERMTTPERIDRMRALRTARAAEMDRRAEATKTFYAALSADQKKVFDGLRMKGGKGGKRGGHGHHRG